MWNKDLWGGELRLYCNFRPTPHTVPPTDVETVKYPHNWCWWTPPVLLKHKPFNWVVNLIWNHENTPLGNVTAEGRPTENGRGKNWIPKLYGIIFYYLTLDDFPTTFFFLTLKQKCCEIQHSQSKHFTCGVGFWTIEILLWAKMESTKQHQQKTMQWIRVNQLWNLRNGNLSPFAKLNWNDLISPIENLTKGNNSIQLTNVSLSMADANRNQDGQQLF